MNIYGLQQKLVEQLLVLGELRGDMLTITENADEDLVEIYNFNVSKDNKYASPENFFKLINACNNLIRVLERNHPEVIDTTADVSNYDRLYGEMLCMRAWAYFNAARIYGIDIASRRKAIANDRWSRALRDHGLREPYVVQRSQV